MPKDIEFDEAALFGNGSTENKENEQVSSKPKKSSSSKPKHYDDAEEKQIKEFQLKERFLRSQKRFQEVSHKMDLVAVKNFNKVLFDERNELLTDFKVVESHGKGEYKYIEKIENLLVEKDQVNNKMEAEKRKQDNLDVSRFF